MAVNINPAYDVPMGWKLVSNGWKTTTVKDLVSNEYKRVFDAAMSRLRENKYEHDTVWQFWREMDLKTIENCRSRQEQENVALREENEKLKKRVGEMGNEASVQRSVSHGLQIKVECLLNEITNLNAKLKEAEEKIETLKRNASRLVNAHNAMKGYQEVVRDRNEKIFELETKLKEANAVASSLRDSVQRLREAAIEKSKETRELQEKLKQFDGIRSFEIERIDYQGLVSQCSGGANSVELMPNADKTLRPNVGDRIAVIPKVEKPKEEWEFARDEVAEILP